MTSFTINGTGELPDAAEWLAGQLGTHRVIALFGPMGAGKTTLIRFLAQHLGVTDTVTSPTFALVNQYSDGNGRPIYHFDFYRIERIEEVYDLGYEEYFYSGGLCLIEWPEKIEPLLPEDTLAVYLTVTGEESRRIEIGQSL